MLYAKQKLFPEMNLGCVFTIYAFWAEGYNLSMQNVNSRKTEDRE